MVMSKPAWAADARTGPVREYIDQRMFACEGMIVVIDHRPTAKEGDCTVLDCDTAEARAKALQKDYRGQTRAQQPRGMQELWTKRLRGCQNILECVKEARAMGDPMTPAVQEFWRRHNRRTASFAQAGPRRSRYDILQQVADKTVPTTLLQTDGSKVSKPGIPRKLILPNSAKQAAEYTPPVSLRKATPVDGS